MNHWLTAEPSENFVVDEQVPKEVWLPETVEQVAEAVRFAAEHNLAVLPLGNGTKRHIGLPPSRYDAALCVRPLQGVVEYSPDDLTVIVKAGTTLSELNHILAQCGQFLPLDPPFPDQATIGGIIATAMTGPCRCLYGGVREHLLGIRVVQPNGEVTRFGGKVVKNVAGYDMTKLYVNSFGTLGVIVEANFKVRPLPETRASLLTWTDDANAVERSLHALVLSDVPPAFAELLNTVAFNNMPLRHLVTSSPRYCLLLGFDGFREEVDWWLTQTRKTAQEAGLTVGDVLEGADEMSLREQVRDFHAGSDAVMMLKAIVPSSEVVAFAETAQQMSEMQAIIAHSLNGFVRIMMREATEPPTETVNGLLHRAVQVGGNLVVEKAPTGWKAQLPVWGQLNESWRWMRRLKETLDPKGIFAPGRFV